ncbi:MAG: HEPN domain-containing protein [Deltaproteobacteria bacterium]|nr:HEPN domain-containing protein [Deltaproteobacteria bacterium]
MAEIHSHAANYLCILVSGALETDVIQMLSDYIGSSQSDEAKGEFLRMAKEKLPNPTIGGIKRVTRGVNKAWENHMEVLLGEHSRFRESIGALNTHRNSIAHGREVKHLTMKNIRSYLESIGEFLVEFNKIIKAK